MSGINNDLKEAFLKLSEGEKTATQLESMLDKLESNIEELLKQVEKREDDDKVKDEVLDE